MDHVEIKVPFDRSELAILARMADSECRHPYEQLRFLFLQEARRRKLLDVVTQPESAESNEVTHELATTD